jgi:hypothetical protein
MLIIELIIAFDGMRIAFLAGSWRLLEAEQ